MTTRKTSTGAKLSVVEKNSKEAKKGTVVLTSLSEGASFKFRSGKFTYKIMMVLKKGNKIVGLELEDSLNRLCKASCKQTLESQVFLV